MSKVSECRDAIWARQTNRKKRISAFGDDTGQSHPKGSASRAQYKINLFIFIAERSLPSCFIKYSMVDVRCVDNEKRQFIVEMQMYWDGAFTNRLISNAGLTTEQVAKILKQYGLIQET